jgi:photosystem II stability/assembly factor-like uncharacterized protein
VALVLSLLLGLVLLLAGCGQAGTGWQSLGPSNGDTVLSLAADPSQPRLIYAGTSGGVVLRARADSTGQPISGSGIPAGAAVSALLPDPRTAGMVYAGTSAGVYVTTDYGDHWHARGSGLPANESLDALAFDPGTTALFVGTTEHGVYISHDGGQTWAPDNTGLPTPADIYVLYWDAPSSTLFAGVDGSGLYASTDGGQSWTPRTQGLPAKVEVFAMADLPSHGLNHNGATLFAGSASGLFASSDGGRSWAAAGQGLPAGRILSLAIDPTVPGWMYAGTETSVYRSADGGAHWASVAPGLSHQVSSIVSVPNPATHYVVYAGVGPLVRFPPSARAANDTLGTIVTWGVTLILLGLGWFLLSRTRRQMLAPLQRPSTPVPGQPPASTAAPAPPAESLNGHKRPPATPGDRNGARRMGPGDYPDQAGGQQTPPWT